MMMPQAELDLLQRLQTYGAQFRDARDLDKPMRAALRLSQDFFGADEGAVIMLPLDRDGVEVAFSVPRSAVWDQAMLEGFLHGEKVRTPPDAMVARVRRRGRRWGVLVVRSAGRHFHWDERRAFSLVASAASELMDRIEQERVREVRLRIDRKIMEQLRPKDLFYQILHGLRSLIEYDHSASLLICSEEMDVLEIVAEQIAWRKGKSLNVGLELPVGHAVRGQLSSGLVLGFDRDRTGWRSWLDADLLDTSLAELLDYHGANGDDDRPEVAMLCAPLVSRDRVLGVLKIASHHSNAFGPYEAEVLSRFVPHAAVALQHSQRAETLEAQMLVSERKHAMADLARGVSHDVNNALGAVIPLVQQIRADAAESRIDPATLEADLGEVERSLQVCRRIFGGMLSFARGTARLAGDVFLHHEVETTLAILMERMERQGVRVSVNVPKNLPPMHAVTADVEQLLLNLCTNAAEAMPDGGTLTIAAAHTDGSLVITVQDTGSGIPPDMLASVQEPFFTTKPAGNGLGLAICRSIVSQLRGRMEIRSEPGSGTTVTVIVQPAEIRA